MVWALPDDSENEALTQNELFWSSSKTPDAAKIVADPQLRALRHIHASQTVTNGEGPHVAARLLRPLRDTTNRYIRPDDESLSHPDEEVTVAHPPKPQPIISMRNAYDEK